MNRSIIVGVLIASAALPATASAQLTVYSSLPLSGAARGQTQAVNDGARQALQEAGGMSVHNGVGQAVRLVTLNDATRRAGNWTPARVQANARRAARDGIALIGAFNSGASALAIPITNEAGLPMVSPSNTAVGLTTGGPGTTRGEPDRYYPSGARTYFRIMPNDKVQAAALATVMRDRGCKQLVSVTDRDVYGRGVGTLVRQDAARLGLQVVRTVRIGQRTRSFGRIRGADCVVYTGVTDNGAVRMFRSVGARMRSAQLFAGDGVAESGFTRGLPASIARRMTLTVSTLAPNAYPGAAIIGSGDPYKIYGYEAMKLILDGLNAGGQTREGLLGYLRSSVQNRASVLGTYSLDANGDTTLRTYGLYGVQRKQLVWSGTINAS